MGSRQGNQGYRPLVLLAVLAALILLSRTTRAPTPYVAPPGALERTAEAVPLAGEFEAQADRTGVPPTPPVAEPLAATTAHLRILTRAGSFRQVDAAAFAEPLEMALAYVSAHTEMQLRAPITVIFDRHPDRCGLDGAAFTERRTIYLYTCGDTPQARAVNILAHEFVHQLAHDHYGSRHLQADLLLSEGLATWGAGGYWLGPEPDYRHFVARHYRAGLLPLLTDYATAQAPDAQNRLYYEWAAFVEWTLATHGRAAFDQLYVNGAERHLGSAPYQAVLGTTLAEVETTWIRWLDEAGG